MPPHTHKLDRLDDGDTGARANYTLVRTGGAPVVGGGYSGASASAGEKTEILAYNRYGL
jgi:hypothetical protein